VGLTSHAQRENLEIDYRVGIAEALPFPVASFDVVVCCDMLEHVADVSKVIAEAARVIKPGGLYLFDTINRTLQSYLETILVAQELPFMRIFLPGTHDWRQFIRPEEMASYLEMHNLRLGELTGLQPGISAQMVGKEISRLKRGEITYAELGRRMKFQTGGGTNGNYIGYAVLKE
jgi:2-polyprenyl-6-hydroxyphenyl methylase/3-demethylubiquinone-9 3-methyltransferase